MFTDHGTFIVAFSIAKDHLAIAPEKKVIDKFSDRIINSGYKYSMNLIKIPWEDSIDYKLLKEIIEFNTLDKKNCLTFWRS